jgi:hypothetical protein
MLRLRITRYPRVADLERWAIKMKPQDVLEELVRIRADFGAYWNDESQHRGGDGSFTACGVFSGFTDFFSERHSEMAEQELVAIGALIERLESDDFLMTAAYTCFLENIAGDPPDKTLAPYLSRRALKFIAQWRSPT